MVRRVGPQGGRWVALIRVPWDERWPPVAHFPVIRAWSPGQGELVTRPSWSFPDVLGQHMVIRISAT